MNHYILKFLMMSFHKESASVRCPQWSLSPGILGLKTNQKIKSQLKSHQKGKGLETEINKIIDLCFCPVPLQPL